MKVIVLTRGGLSGTLIQGIESEFQRVTIQKVWLNIQKSVLSIVPFKPTERIGEGRDRRSIDRLTKG